MAQVSFAGRPPDPGPGPEGGSPSGRHRYNRADVEQMQRLRLMRALVQAVCERGARNLSVGEIVSRAGISRRTFYELFADSEECFLAAFDYSVERIAGRVTPAYEAQAQWLDAIRAGLVALLELLDEDPVVGRFLFVESLGAGRATLERRARVVAGLVTAVDRGREVADAGAPPPSPLAAEGVVGAVCAVLHSRLLTPGKTPFVRLAEPLMSMIVLPYLGPDATQAELRRPKPRVRKQPQEVAHDGDIDLIRTLGMRVTYRTACALIAIAENPNASNRQIGQKAGIVDQGQMSKLLHRLHRLGLVENARREGRHGTPNEWVLTPRGEEVRRAIGAGSF
jgi:AcrR family transcriptional regulator/DNA-binding MarR family transcriptional regulator